MSVTEQFKRHFRALESALNVEGCLDQDPGVNFDVLTKICETDPVFAEQLTQYGCARMNFLRARTMNCRERSRNNVDLLNEVTELIFHSLIASVGFKFPKGNQPKVHHWLPISYTRDFGSLTSKHDPKARKRSCTIKSLTFTRDGEALEQTVPDLHFAHGIDVEGKGFYHLNAEYFFGRIESMFAEAKGKYFEPPKHVGPGHDIFPRVALAAFFVVQSVRNPHPSSAIFSIRTFNGVVQGLMNSLDTLPAIYTTVANVKSNLVFTPYVPTRIRMLSNGNRALTFPINPHSGFIISDKPVDSRDSHKIVDRSNRAVINHAKKNGSIIFGVGHSEMKAG